MLLIWRLVNIFLNDCQCQCFRNQYSNTAIGGLWVNWHFYQLYCFVNQNIYQKQEHLGCACFNQKVFEKNSANELICLTIEQKE